MQYFTQDHELFRQSLRQFVEKEIVPFIDEWEKQAHIPREIWKKMGEMGYFGINHAEEYGGTNLDFFFSAVYIEEISRTLAAGFPAAITVHQYMAVAHLAKAGSHFLKEKYLTPAILGEKIGALAITEPNGGSDVGALRTSALKEGEEYVINGSKTFITNSVYGDFITVACRTKAGSKGADGISLIVVDRNTEGLTVNKLDKMGWNSSDTGEVFFDNVRVPISHLIGEEGQGFFYIMESFQVERLVGALMGISGAAHTLEVTLKYASEREAFGKKIQQFQVLRHRIADMATEIEAAKCLTYSTCWKYINGEYVAKEAAMVKLYASEVGKKVADECLQFFGGYGFMNDFPISRVYRDARVATIVAGTSEIMREIIAKIVIDEVKYTSSYQLAGNSEQSSMRAEKKPETAVEIIRSIPSRFRAEKGGDYTTIVHFDISGEKGGQFTAVIEKGACILHEGLLFSPKCLIQAQDSDYADIELGRLNPQAAYMTGKIKVSDIMEMMQFTKMFRRV